MYSYATKPRLLFLVEIRQNFLNKQNILVIKLTVRIL